MRRIKIRGAAMMLMAVMSVVSVMGGCQKKDGSPSEPAQNTESVPVVEPDGDGETAGQESDPAQPPVKEEPEIQAPSMTREEYPQVDGSTATIPLSVGLYRLVTGASTEEAEAAIEHTKTTNAYNRLIYNNVDLVLAYEPAPSVYQLMEENKVNLIIKPIGKDALVFMANEGNPVTSLTGQEIVDIYRGSKKNWAEVGGQEKEIVAFQRPSGSGSQTLMEKLVMQDVPMDSQVPKTSVIGEMGELIEAVSSYNNEENALGYSVYFYAKNMFAKPGLRFMEVDGVLPSNETIKDGTYPYVNEFYAAIREDEPKDSSAYQLFEWLTTPDGQSLVEELGYVGLKEVPYPSRLQLKDDSNGEEAVFSFGKEYRLLLDCQQAYGTEGVAVLNEDMELERVISGVKAQRTAMVAGLEDPVIFQNSQGFAGVYRVGDDSWLIEPEYWTLDQMEDGTYQGYRMREEGNNQRMILSWNGSRFKVREAMDGQIGNRIWEVQEEKKRAVIRDLTGAVVKEVDFQAYGNYSYGWVQAPYFVAFYQDGSAVLFDYQGQVVFQKAFVNQSVVSLSEISKDGVLSLWQGEDGQPFIYHLKKKKRMTNPGDQIGVISWDKESFYVANQQLFQADGTPVAASDGKPFTHAIGRGYFARQEKDVLVVEKRDASRRYVLPVTNPDAIEAIAEDVFCISAYHGTGGGVYQGERCLADEEGIGWWNSDETVIATDYHSRSIVFNQSGRILYESHIPERILYAGNGLMVINRGSYMYITDYEGRCGLKLLRGYMADD